MDTNELSENFSSLVYFHWKLEGLSSAFLIFVSITDRLIYIQINPNLDHILTHDNLDSVIGHMRDTFRSSNNYGLGILEGVIEIGLFVNENANNKTNTFVSDNETRQTLVASAFGGNVHASSSLQVYHIEGQLEH